MLLGLVRQLHDFSGNRDLPGKAVCGEDHTTEMWAEAQLLSPAELGHKLRVLCRSTPGRVSVGQLLHRQRNCGARTVGEILKWIGEPDGPQDEASVNLTFCVHCGCYTVNQQADNCVCGGELDATSMNVPPGTRILGEIVNAAHVSVSDGDVGVDEARTAERGR